MTSWYARLSPEEKEAFKEKVRAGQKRKKQAQSVPEVEHIRISTTERQTFKGCRLQWHFSSYSQCSLEPKLQDTRLWFGTGIHEALDAYYGEGIDPVEFWDAWTTDEFSRLQASGVITFAEEWGTLIEHQTLGRGMLQHYLQFAREVDDFEVVMTEQQFEVPIPHPETGETMGFLVGRFDGVCKTPDGRLWLLEHKTAAQAWASHMFLNDDQTLGYLWAAQQVLGKQISGVYFNILRKKLPRTPKVLKSGKLSVAKDQDTTYAVYLATIEELGLDAEDYTEMLERLELKGNTFFQRERITRTPRELEVWGRQLSLEYIDMARNPAIYPNLTWDCNWRCDFKSLCNSWRNGEDWKVIADAQFQRRQHTYEVYTPLKPKGL